MMRADKEQLENEQIQSSHPPEEYADTFTAQDKAPEEIVRLYLSERDIYEGLLKITVSSTLSFSLDRSLSTLLF